MRWSDKFREIVGNRSATKIAAKVGMKGNTLSNLLRINRMPSAWEGLCICRVIDVDPVWFFDEDQGMETMSKWNGRYSDPTAESVPLVRQDLHDLVDTLWSRLYSS